MSHKNAYLFYFRSVIYWIKKPLTKRNWYITSPLCWAVKRIISKFSFWTFNKYLQSVIIGSIVLPKYELSTRLISNENKWVHCIYHWQYCSANTYSKMVFRVFWVNDKSSFSCHRYHYLDNYLFFSTWNDI